MPILTATITALGLYGGPAPANESYAGRANDPPSTRTYTEDFTTLGLFGGPTAPDGSFDGRDELAFYEKAASDTVRAYVNESPTSNIDLDSSDYVAPVISDAYSSTTFKVASDSVIVRLTDTYTALLKSSIVKTASDSAVPVITDTGAIRVLISAADSLVPVITDAYTALGQANEKTASDSIVPVISEAISLNQLAANRDVSAEDNVRVYVFETSNPDPLGEVDRITIVPRIGQIRITKA